MPDSLLTSGYVQKYDFKYLKVFGDFTSDGWSNGYFCSQGSQWHENGGKYEILLEPPQKELDDLRFSNNMPENWRKFLNDMDKDNDGEISKTEKYTKYKGNEVNPRDKAVFEWAE